MKDRHLARTERARLTVCLLAALVPLPGCRVLLEPLPSSELLAVSAEFRGSSQPAEGALRDQSKIEVPAALPGAQADSPELPPDTPQTREARMKAIEALFPELPNLGDDPLPGVDKIEPVTVEALIETAKKNSPLIQQAMAEIERNRGLWVQAGLYPNPTMGYQGDQVGDAGSAGQQGGFFNQTIVTGQKLKLARNVAYFDLINARLQLRRQEIDLTRQVRADLFAVMVAAEGIRITRKVSEFTEDVYRAQVAGVRAGVSVPFEAHALRAIAGQNRNSLVQARLRYASVWRQLAATLNQPEMPPTPIASRVDLSIPRYNYEALKQKMIAAHTDMEIARNNVAQAQQNLLLETRRPIPDLQNNFYFQRDTQLQSFQVGIQLGVTVPVWNKNEGNISAARASLFRATQELDRVRNNLIRTMTDSYERYETNRQQITLYRDLILPDLVRAFRGIYRRFQVEPDKVNYNDIVTAQQNFATQLNNYLQALQQQWQAVADLTANVQAEDPYKLSEGLDTALPDDWPLEPRRVVR